MRRVATEFGPADRKRGEDGMDGVQITSPVLQNQRGTPAKWSLLQF